MARNFNGSSQITLSPGNTVGMGFGSIAAIIRRSASSTDGVVALQTSASGKVWYIEFDGTDFIFGIGAADTAFGTAFAPATADGWTLVVGTKATGTVTPVVYKMSLAAGATLVSQNGPGTAANPTGVISKICIGQGFPGELFQGDIAAIGLWNGVVLTTAQIQSLASSWDAWYSASELPILDQSVITMPVRSLTGTAAQTAITGTTLSTVGVPIGYGAPILLDVVISAGGGGGDTNAPAGLASISMSGFDASVAVKGNAAMAAITVTANDPAASLKPTAGTAVITATGQNMGGTDVVTAGFAPITVVVQQAMPLMNPNAGSSSITFTAYNNTIGLGPNASTATVTVTAYAPSTQVRATPSVATISITAFNATAVQGIFAAAGMASITFTVFGASSTVLATAGQVAISVTAFNATTLTGVLAAAGLASIAFTVFNATVTLKPTAGVAIVSAAPANGSTDVLIANAGTGLINVVANQSSVTVSSHPTAGLISFSVTAFDATVQGSGAAPASAAIVSLSAFNPSAKLWPVAGSSLITFTVFGPTTKVGPVSSTAIISMVAFNATTSQAILVHPTTAIIAVTAYNASVSIGATAATALISTAALGDLLSIKATASVAVLTMTGYNGVAVASHGFAAQLAVMTMVAFNATVRISREFDGTDRVIQSGRVVQPERVGIESETGRVSITPVADSGRVIISGHTD